jgi:hypothetical protein
VDDFLDKVILCFLSSNDIDRGDDSSSRRAVGVRRITPSGSSRVHAVVTVVSLPDDGYLLSTISDDFVRFS